MDFGDALKEVKKGKRIARKGWNGKGQYVVLAKMEKCTTLNTSVETTNHRCIGNHFLLFVGTLGVQCGWLASQADMLAEDWRAW